MAIANTTIRIKRSITTGVTPASLANGEIAINLADGKLFYQLPGGSVSSIQNQLTFGTISSNGSLITATTPTDILTLVPGNNVTFLTDTVNKKITINSSFDSANANIAVLFGIEATQNANISLLQSGLNSANANIVSLQTLANTDYTTLTSTAGTFGSSTLVPVVTVAANGRVISVSNTQLGSIYSTVQAPFSGTLSSSSFGTAIQLSGNVTLPLASSGPAGGKINFYSQGTYTITVASPGTGEFIYSGSGSIIGTSNRSVTLYEGETLELTSRGGTEWDITGGTAGLKYQPQANVRSLSFPDGTTQSTAAGGAATDTFARNLAQAAFNQANVTAGGLVTANANTVYLQAGLNTANANTVYIQSGLNSANANVNILFGIELSQNANISLLQSGLITANSNTAYLQAGLNTANANTVYITGGLNSANANIALLQTGLNSANGNISALFGIETTQNSSIVYIQSGLNTANANTVYLQAGLNTANANTVYLTGGLNSANANISLLQSGLNSANGNISALFGIEVTQNASIVYIQSGLNTANANTVYLQFGLNTANANTVYLQAGLNSANANIVSLQALANTDYTTLTSTAGTFGSSTLVPVVTVASNGRVTSVTTTAITGGSGGTSSNSFSTIVISGQPNLIANTPNSQLTFVAGSGINFTAVGTSNTLTISSTGGFSGGTISNALTIANTTTSISNSTGALIVTGGAGISGNLHANVIYTDTLRYEANGLPWVMGGGGGSSGIPGWTYITSPTTLVKGTQYLANTIAGSFTVTMPASATLGDEIIIQDGYNFQTNNLIVNPNGLLIEGQSGNLILNLPKVTVTLVYDGLQWKVTSSVNTSGSASTVYLQSLFYSHS